MDYIVFDLEWNQCPEGKGKEEPRLPFEIIEIGAVKLNSSREIQDKFHELINPQVYRWIHSKTREVIHMDYKSLTNSRQFPQVISDFLSWCGEDFVFCSWGSLDVMELQRNMKYYNMLDLLPGPIMYYDVQKLFSINFEDRKSRKSLEYAIDFLKLDKDLVFHQALADAWYTARILQKLDEPRIFTNTSIDVYQNPKSKKEEIHLSYDTYDKFISREFSDKERAMKDREVTSTRCPLCGRNARRKIRWFTVNSKQYYSVSVCQEHGLVKGKIRMKKTDEDKVYVVKTIKNIDETEADEIKKKQEAMRRKRRIKKSIEKANAQKSRGSHR